MRNVMKSGPRAQAGGTSVAVIAVSLLTLAGCGAVHPVEPVGTVPVVVDPLEWNGYWATPDNLAACGQWAGAEQTGCLVVTVIDAAQGVLAIVPEGKDVEPARAYLRVADKPNAVFLTFEDWNSDAPERPLLLMRGVLQQMDPSGGCVVLWRPVAERFGALVKTGFLPPGAGPTAGPNDDQTLGLLGPPELDLIARTMKWELFDWEDPIIYVRVVPSAQSTPPKR